MSPSKFMQAATDRANSNLTGNVAAVAASADGPNLSVTYFLYGPETEADEENREQFVGELLGDFPKLFETSNEAEIVSAAALSGRNDLVFRRI